ncbi:hypothetical protein FAGKG844_20186 [Frankia sp. AgKG'84/4]
MGAGGTAANPGMPLDRKAAGVARGPAPGPRRGTG